MREKCATHPSTSAINRTLDTAPTPPPGAELICKWEDHFTDRLPYRSVLGVDRTVTDHPARVYSTVVQLADGSIEDNGVSSPAIFVCDDDSGCLPKLNSDQARELAAALLECAAELDGWTQR